MKSLVALGLLILVPSLAGAQVRTLLPLIPPYVRSADGVKATGGQVVDVMMEASRRAGLSLLLEIQPWARAFATAVATRDILLSPVVRTPERESLFEWIGPVSRVEYHVFRLRSSAVAAIRSLDQLGRRSVGVLNKDASDRYLQTVIDPRQIEPVPEYHNLIQMFLAGRFDYLAVVPQGLFEELSRLKLPKETVESLFALDYTADPYSYVVAAKGSSPTLVANLSKALASMQKDGTWENLYRQYE